MCVCDNSTWKCSLELEKKGSAVLSMYSVTVHPYILCRTPVFMSASGQQAYTCVYVQLLQSLVLFLICVFPCFDLSLKNACVIFLSVMD